MEVARSAPEHSPPGRSESARAKSSGVSALLAKTDGGICYVDVAYALQNHFALFAIKNRAGKFETPGLRNDHRHGKPGHNRHGERQRPRPQRRRSAQAIAAEVQANHHEERKSLRAKILKYRKAVLAKARAKNKKLEIAYPICTFTYVIVPISRSQATDLKTFFKWALTTGQASSFERTASLRRDSQSGSDGLAKSAQPDPHARHCRISETGARALRPGARFRFSGASREEAANGQSPRRARSSALTLAAGGDDHVLDDRQAQPRAAAGSGSVGAVEALEEAGKVLGGDTGAVVRDRQLDPALGQSLNQERAGRPSPA